MKKTIIKWSCAFLAAVILVGATAVVSFWAAKKSFEDEAFLVKSNKISFDEEEVDENLIAKFKEIKRRIGEEYYLEYDENDLVEGAIQGMVDGLNDPYTQYFTAQEMESWNSQLQGEYVGTGFIVSEQTEEYILIGSVKEETPAAYAELKAGDKIVSINEKNISEYTESEIWELFATEGVTLTLSMVRNEETIETTLTVSNIVEQSVFSELLENNIGYVRIASFDAKAAEDFETEVSGLLNRGMQSMVLDLRYNSGGLASIMSLIADSILPDGAMIYYEVDKEQQRSQVKYSDAKALNIPIVVLVNGSTASVAEVLASTLRDNDVAKLVGTKTYGKSVAQITVPFADGTGLVLTVAQYYTASDYNIQGNGLTPDMVVEPMDEYKNTKVQYIPRENDVQLTAAINLLTGTENNE